VFVCFCLFLLPCGLPYEAAIQSIAAGLAGAAGKSIIRMQRISLYQYDDSAGSAGLAIAAGSTGAAGLAIAAGWTGAIDVAVFVCFCCLSACLVRL
jgi:hypothetical protein